MHFIKKNFVLINYVCRWMQVTLLMDECRVLLWWRYLNLIPKVRIKVSLFLKFLFTSWKCIYWSYAVSVFKYAQHVSCAGLILWISEQTKTKKHTQILCINSEWEQRVHAVCPQMRFGCFVWKYLETIFDQSDVTKF